MHQRMRVAALAAVFAAVALASSVSAQATPPCDGVIEGAAPYKVRAALRAFCIQPPAQASFNLDEPVQYAGYDSSDEFVLAYNRVASSGAIEQHLHFVHLDKLKQTWTAAEFPGMQTEILPGTVGLCEGTVGGVQKADELFYVAIELSPSAECLVVISGDLKLQKVFSGWITAEFSSGAVVLEGSTRHFAPTHPLRLSVFNPRDGSIKSIYPVENDPFRARYIQRLRTEISPADRCEGENCELDPEQFDNELTPVCLSVECKPAIAVSDEAVSLVFGVQFSPIGFVRFDKVNWPEWNEQVVFVYRFVDGRVEYREFARSEIEARFGTRSIDALLTPDMLKRVFGGR
jgi:hypothetical protein